jgi:Ca2+-binding RTX toxin-like protein
MRSVGGASFVLRRSSLLLAILLLVGAASGAGSAFGATIADWKMNERAGASTMHDSSGTGLNGAIGSAVVTGVVTDGATGYQWLSTNRSGVHTERLIQVDSSLLNPGIADFTFIMRFKTSSFGDQNIVQKGQAKTAGGQWKIAIKKGKIVCNFLGVVHRSAVWSNETIADNNWHTVRCDRRTTGVTITIDGGTPKTNHNWTGSISNTWPVAIGGKPKCDGGVTVGCDYFVGLIDRVVIARSQCDGVAATMTGTSGVDELVGTPDRDVIVGNGGADEIRGRGGNDLICAGAGKDQIEGNAGNDVLRGGAGFDSGFGGRGADACISVELARSC